MVAGERQIAEVGGDTGNEAQHTDEQEDDADDGGGLLHVCAGATGCDAIGHDGKTPWKVVLRTLPSRSCLIRCGRMVTCRAWSASRHACLDSNRVLLLTGIGADAHDGAGYRGHRPLQQLQLGLRTCHVGWSCGARLAGGDTGTLGSWDTLR